MKQNLENMIKTDYLYSLDDIVIIPSEISEIRSRKDCSLDYESIEGKQRFTPLIAAPMDSVVSSKVFPRFWDSGISCVIPRTEPLSERLKLCSKVFCAFGLNEVSENFLDQEFQGDKLHILIDIANGHLSYQLKLGEKLREKYGDRLKLMGGNIANPSTYRYYSLSGFDYVRVGIGGGFSCITSTQSSVHYPMASLLDEIKDRKNPRTKIIADGGIRTYSDAIKCLALGADYVMMGYTFSKTREAAGDIYTEDGRLVLPEDNIEDEVLYKDYHGMSTKEAQAKILGVDLRENRGKLKTSEGRCLRTKIEYTLPGWIDNFNSYLRSAMSYTGIKTLKEFIGSPEIRIISNSSREKLNK